MYSHPSARDARHVYDRMLLDLPAGYEACLCALRSTSKGTDMGVWVDNVARTPGDNDIFRIDPPLWFVFKGETVWNRLLQGPLF